MSLDQKIAVTTQSYPRLHAAFRAIEYDNGGQLIGTHYPGEKIDLDTFQVPSAWGPLLAQAEAGLARLDEKDFETFVVGEHSDQENIRERQGDLTEAHTVLNDYFDGWPERG